MIGMEVTRPRKFLAHPGGRVGKAGCELPSELVGSGSGLIDRAGPGDVDDLRDRKGSKQGEESGE